MEAGAGVAYSLHVVSRSYGMLNINSTKAFSSGVRSLTFHKAHTAQ